MSLPIEITDDAEQAARRAAARIAARGRDTISSRSVFTLALSGGSTPRRMLHILAGENVPWRCVHVFQADERVAPPGHADRNLVGLREALGVAPLPAGRLHPMPVEARDLGLAARAYERELADAAGQPPVLDVVHLGLGRDGHTASLMPGDPVLGVSDADVAVTTDFYQGHRRMTLTYPVLARARHVLWLVTGTSKAPMLERLLAGDASIPAGRVPRDRALVIADRAAAGLSAGGTRGGGG